ncbi:MAG: DMT family transporter [Patescibacteria group bacterium]
MKILKSGPLLIVIASVLWALDGIIRRSLFTLPAITIVFYEHLIGAIILLPFVFKSFLKEKLTKKELLLLIAISLLSGLLGTLWFTTALLKTNYISFSVVFLLQKLQPLFAISTAVIFLKEKISRKYLLWAGLALISAYFVTFKEGIVDFKADINYITAALYALGAAFAWGASTTLSKIALLKKPDTYVTALRFIFTSFFAFITVFILQSQASLFAPSTSQYLRFTFIAVSTGMVAVLIYYKGLKKTEVKVSTILELTFPMLAIIIDAVLYKSFLSPIQIFSASVLMYSMYKVSHLRNNR